MKTVLDPQLLQLVEQAQESNPSVWRPVEVMVGLRSAATDAQISQLKASGMTMRSQVGDVLTGIVKIGDVRVLAALPFVLKIELSSPVFGEAAPSPPELPTE